MNSKESVVWDGRMNKVFVDRAAEPVHHNHGDQLRHEAVEMRVQQAGSALSPSYPLPITHLSCGGNQRFFKQFTPLSQRRDHCAFLPF